MIILGNYFSSCNVSIIGPTLSSVSGHRDNDEVHTDCMHRNSPTNVMYFGERRLFLVYMSSFCRGTKRVDYFAYVLQFLERK